MKDAYEKLGYFVGATVRQYHNVTLFDDAKILHVHSNGALDVEISGVKYGWSVRTCAPLEKLEQAAKEEEALILKGTSSIKPKGFI